MTTEFNTGGVQLIWAGTNPDETKVFAYMEMGAPSLLKSSGEREDIATVLRDAVVDGASTEVISAVGDDYWL